MVVVRPRLEFGTDVSLSVSCKHSSKWSRWDAQRIPTSYIEFQVPGKPAKGPETVRREGRRCPERQRIKRLDICSTQSTLRSVLPSYKHQSRTWCGFHQACGSLAWLTRVCFYLGSHVFPRSEGRFCGCDEGGASGGDLEGGGGLEGPGRGGRAKSRWRMEWRCRWKMENGIVIRWEPGT